MRRSRQLAGSCVVVSVVGSRPVGKFRFRNSTMRSLLIASCAAVLLAALAGFAQAPKPPVPGFYALYCWSEGYLKYAQDVQKVGIRWLRVGNWTGSAETKKPCSSRLPTACTSSRSWRWIPARRSRPTPPSRTSAGPPAPLSGATAPAARSGRSTRRPKPTGRSATGKSGTSRTSNTSSRRMIPTACCGRNSTRRS